VVLETLTPPERLAFVLHDMFGVPFDDIAGIVDRSPDAARQLASRARRRVREGNAEPDADLDAQREVVDAFVAASREGDFGRLVAVLDPDVVLRADFGPDAPLPFREVRGAEEVAQQAEMYSRIGLELHPVLVNGAVGFLATRDGERFSVGGFTIRGGRIAAMDILADPVRLARLDLTVLDG
jgi:RNA polymerase sigma-70 factor (ECF subfamily)